MQKTYLGDGVYVDLTEWGEIILTTEDGLQETNKVLMDGSVLANFEEYLKEVRRNA